LNHDYTEEDEEDEFKVFSFHPYLNGKFTFQAFPG
jgi:hypothetical protein